MHILVLVKQIPDVNRIQFDPATMRIRREGVPLLMNAFDRKAVEEAMRIKERVGGKTSVVTMGPPSAKDVIVESLRMGIDDGYLITDREFAGADTFVTSKVLSAFVRSIRPDIVLAGKYSLDGETSQVPPEIAEMTGYSFKSSVSKIELGDEGYITVEQEREDGMGTFDVPLPAVISVSEKINRARMPAAASPEFESRVSTVDEMRLKSGARGADSPTVVVRTEKVENLRKPEFMEQGDAAFELVVKMLKSRSAVNAEPINLEEIDSAKGEIWGVALNDTQTAFEISSKLAEISMETHYFVRMTGNIEPERLQGMLCHSYRYAECSDNELIAETLAARISEEKPKFVVIPSTVDGREISSAVAAKLGLGLTADCIDLAYRDGSLMQYKPAFGGGLVAAIISKTRPEMATVRPGMLRRRHGSAPMHIEKISIYGKPKVKRMGFTMVEATYRPLQGSRVVIGLGRGLKSKENVSRVFPLAQKLGAAIAGSRPIVDAGWVPQQQQVGLTGLSISPDVYIALGISGQDNHVVGIRYAGRVIAVNNNRNAPIFRYADLAIVGDLFSFVDGLANYIDTKSITFTDEPMQGS
jgi:electron transfer flavoprotein alpha subunit